MTEATDLDGPADPGVFQYTRTHNDPFGYWPKALQTTAPGKTAAGCVQRSGELLGAR